jgi:hypothetical protein
MNFLKNFINCYNVFVRIHVHDYNCCDGHSHYHNRLFCNERNLVRDYDNYARGHGNHGRDYGLHDDYHGCGRNYHVNDYDRYDVRVCDHVDYDHNH